METYLLSAKSRSLFLAKVSVMDVSPTSKYSCDSIPFYCNGDLTVSKWHSCHWGFLDCVIAFYFMYRSNIPFLYPLTTSENLKSSDIYRAYRNYVPHKPSLY